MSFKVKTSNRAAAKRLLNVWHDSKAVRYWTVQQLQESLTNAVNEGLITAADVRRALHEQTAIADNKMDEDAHVSSNDTEDEDEDEDAVMCEQRDEDEDAQARAELDAIAECVADSEDSDSESDSEDDNAESNEEQSEDDSDSEQESDTPPPPPPPLDSEQPFVTHPELQEARTADQAYALDVATEKAQNVAKLARALTNSCNKSIATHTDALSERIEALAKKAESARPKTITVKMPDRKPDSEVKIDSPHMLFETVLKYVHAGLNVALVGPAGCGKSYLTQQLAKALKLDYYTNGALLTKFDLIGFVDASGSYHSTPAYEAFVNGGLHVFDELDASSPEAVVAFNGMTDGQGFYTFPNGMQTKHEDYRAIACMNTFGNGASAEYVGRFRQDAAAMNRYVRILIDYDRDLEAKLVSEDIAVRGWAIRDACEKLGIKHIVSTRSLVYCESMRAHGATRKELDAHCLFAGLTDDTVKQLRAAIKGDA
jgi:hypothetical protein